MATPQSPKFVQYMQWLSFATLPILLLVFIAAPYKVGETTGDTILPVAVSTVSFVAAIFWLLNRMNSEQEPAQFQTNLIIALALGELSTLMGIFLGLPAGLSPYPFVGANYLILVFGLIRLNNYWSQR